VNTDNAKQWLDAGASHVIVTSFVFRDGRLEEDRLKDLVSSARVPAVPMSQIMHFGIHHRRCCFLCWVLSCCHG
jgi:hypothetical protein